METNDLVRNLAKTVETAIESAGRTRQNVATATGIAANTMRRRCSGHGQSFYAAELNAIANELHTTASALLLDAEQMAA